VPAVREVAIDCGPQVSALIDGISAGRLSIVIFSTGVGAAAVFQEAEKLGRLPELLELLKKVTTVCRGPKPSAVLSRYGLPISIKAREPFTTAQVLEAISALQLQETGVAVLHYGERNLPLVEALQARGARIEELFVYEWQMPEDVGPLQQLAQEIIEGRVNAVAFTSQIQARHLFQIAQADGCAVELANALNHKTIVAAIGPTCTASLEEFGVTPHVVPQPPKMGPMVSALAEYWGSNDQVSDKL
jgi:uroporphyrinogen-III synthase